MSFFRNGRSGRHADLPPGPYVLLTVSDTGSGMDEATKAHIFEPFFTTKEVGKGTGLGLATVFGIVKQSGGFIEVDSVLGSGSTFRIYFPQIGAEVRLKEAEPRPGEDAAGGWRRFCWWRMKTACANLPKWSLRHTATRSSAPVTASRRSRSAHDYADDIHLMFTDVVMPKMSGRQLTDFLDPTRPNMKVLYMSGYTDDTIVRHGIEDAGTNFLPKPFTQVTLTQKVREVLDGMNGHEASRG